MIFRGLKPIEVNDPVIEVVTDDRWYDLHNAGWIRSIALEAPADLVLVIDYLEPERQGIATGPDGVLELHFVNVSMLSVAQYEDNVPENTTLEHLVYWPPRAGEMRRDTHRDAGNPIQRRRDPLPRPRSRGPRARLKDSDRRLNALPVRGSGLALEPA
jgi:hypothetical protein